MQKLAMRDCRLFADCLRARCSQSGSGRLTFTGHESPFTAPLPMSTPSANLPTPSSSTASRLLLAAADLLGGEGPLARRLGIQPTLLVRFMSGQKELPAELLLRTVDIVLEVRDCGELILDAGSRDTEPPGP